MGGAIAAAAIAAAGIAAERIEEPNPRLFFLLFEKDADLKSTSIPSSSDSSPPIPATLLQSSLLAAARLDAPFQTLGVLEIIAPSWRICLLRTPRDCRFCHAFIC